MSQLKFLKKTATCLSFKPKLDKVTKRSKRSLTIAAFRQLSQHVILEEQGDGMHELAGTHQALQKRKKTEGNFMIKPESKTN
ncbi:hypothetical protein Y1Q_0004312 [Alligator mississippiensis]|uniref:Uncharacterized protein n=1 Tax=Alligator mississippiensis TaxID=8496 RepID=A0A151MIH4_ALLMI|nr:hypothetical protein Y1Q_0004312 [Alligator mississippiensis]